MKTTPIPMIDPAAEYRSLKFEIDYPIPLHRQPAYAAANRGLSLPASERISSEVLSLPINPLLDAASVDRICNALTG